MTLRTNAANVKAIMDTELTESQITPFLTPANLLVTDKLTGEGLSDTHLIEIEKYLTAHFVTMGMGGDIEEEWTPEYKVRYAKKGIEKGNGLHATSYGKLVLTLDTTGKLSALGKKNIVFEAMETNDS